MIVVIIYLGFPGDASGRRHKRWEFEPWVGKIL